MASRELAGASTAFERALVLDPAHAPAHQGIAECCELRGDADGAAMHFAQAFAQADVFGAAVSRDGTPGPRAPPRSLPHPDDRSSRVDRGALTEHGWTFPLLLRSPGFHAGRNFAFVANAAELGLDYAGIDFALDARGDVVLFEANATMAVYPPPPGAHWDYRRPAVERIVAAVRALLVNRGGRPVPRISTTPRRA
jgi:hypothetical protein